MLARADIARYARHLLLPEIGQTGQERLLQSAVAFPSSGDARALEVARDYLQRAGIAVRVGGEPAALPDATMCRALASRAELEEAAAALAGAFHAVEAIKRVLGLGEAATLSGSLLPAEELAP